MRAAINGLGRIRAGGWAWAVALGLGACGARGPETPEDAAKAMLAAAARGDTAGFRAAFPSRDELAEILSCPPGIDLGARFDGLNEDLVAWRNRPPQLVEPAFSQTVAESVVPGGPVGGCEAKQPLVLVRMDVRVLEGESERILAMRLVGFDQRFRVLGY